MKTRIEIIKQLIEHKKVCQINFGCSRKIRGPFITETDSEFIKLSLKLATVQKRILRKNIFKVFFRKNKNKHPKI